MTPPGFGKTRSTSAGNFQASDSYCDRRPDRSVRDVVLQPEILETEGEQVLDLQVDPHRRQRLRRAIELLARLIEVIRIEVRVAKRVDKISRLEAGHLGNHH